MLNKKNFIQFVNLLVKECSIDELKESNKEIDFEDALDYFDKKIVSITSATKKGSGKFTDNGRKVFDFMVENKDTYENDFKAVDIAEGLFISGRSVSGTIRKLVTDGYVTKDGESPIRYSLTELTGTMVDTVEKTTVQDK